MSDARGHIIDCASQCLVSEPSYYKLHFVGLAADCPSQEFPAIHPILLSQSLG